jgi:hypothetical protein
MQDASDGVAGPLAEMVSLQSKANAVVHRKPGAKFSAVAK